MPDTAKAIAVMRQITDALVRDGTVGLLTYYRGEMQRDLNLTEDEIRRLDRTGFLDAGVPNA